MRWSTRRSPISSIRAVVSGSMPGTAWTPKHWLRMFASFSRRHDSNAAAARAAGHGLTTHAVQPKAGMTHLRGCRLALKDISAPSWPDAAEVRVVTFSQLSAGTRGGQRMRQYWKRRRAAWETVSNTDLR